MSTHWDVTPAIDASGNLRFIGCNNVHCVLPDGTISWSSQEGELGHMTPALDAAGNLYYYSINYPEQSLVAFDPNGDLLWTVALPILQGSSVSIGADGTLYLGGLDGYLYAVGD